MRTSPYSVCPLYFLLLAPVFFIICHRILYCLPYRNLNILYHLPYQLFLLAPFLNLISFQRNLNPISYLRVNLNPFPPCISGNTSDFGIKYVPLCTYIYVDLYSIEAGGYDHTYGHMKSCTLGVNRRDLML